MSRRDAGARWVVRAGDGGTIEDIVRLAGADASALREGRVFLGRVRASEGRVVCVGDVVTVAPPAERAGAATILVDEDGLVAADKPAGIPTIPDHGGAAHALISAVAATIGCAPTALHPTSRLDRDVSGVVVFARTTEAAERLVRARREGVYRRRYVAIAGGVPVPAKGVWEGPIGRAKDPRLREVGGRDPVEARSRYETIAVAGTRALLALDPETGRTHQLRVHAAHGGAALLGDRDYGGPARVTMPSGRVLGLRRVALHAARVVMPRSSGGTLEVRAGVPPELLELWIALGGRDADWEAAIRAPDLR